MATTLAAAYYRHPQVRTRLREACGLSGTGTGASAVFVAGLGPGTDGLPDWEHVRATLPADLERLCEAGCDIARSLWDRRRLIFLFEIDYLNVDQPGEAFLHPAEVFFKLEPVFQATRRVLRQLAIGADAVMTGRGYHFSGGIPLDDPLIDRLARLTAGEPAWHRDIPRRLPAGLAASMSGRHARAADGLGRLIEYLAHLVAENVAERSPIPVVFNGTVVGSGVVGRECASLDFSHVGDPLDVRHFRVAFSTYQWHRFRPDIFGPRASTAVAELVTLPRGRRSLAAMLRTGRTLEAGVRLAGGTRALMPDVTRGVSALLDAYLESPLAALHRQFDSDAEHAATDPAARLDGLPPCVRRPLLDPNDALLKPERIQHVVRVLMARGWRPADIAALVQARYEHDHGWGDRWTRLNAESRARFDVRVFAGLIGTGLDTLVDLNCVSAQEKDVCPRVECQLDLRRDRERLEALRNP